MPDYLKHLKNIQLTPSQIIVHTAPYVWRGDRFGHIGAQDMFFRILKGICYVMIDFKSYVLRPGQLAFFPKGKMRTYSHMSSDLVMYEMTFQAQTDGENLMEFLGLCDGEWVVDIADTQRMDDLFLTSFHKEMYKDPILSLTWCANILEIIKMYNDAKNGPQARKKEAFRAVVDHMQNHLSDTLTTQELSSVVYMQPSYFIRRFREAFGETPQNYLAKLRVHNAMTQLLTTDLPVEKIAASLGFEDASYFARVFKKHCEISPSEFRKLFSRN